MIPESHAPSDDTSSTGDSTDPHWARVTKLVDAALCYQSPESRARFLSEACRDDDDLRREVEHLLEFEHVDGGLLDRPPGQGLGPGDAVGPYRIAAHLGDGGMGVVLRVHDPELERDVALKLLHRRRLTPDLLRRFQVERRILARLDHPGIARILGGGTLDGSPFFTMEIVDGEPIDAYCDRHHLTVTERLHLVLEVCEALAYAHRNLVVHRDLKPSNLLVTAAGRPKLLDFGIAKDLDAETARTRTGQQPFTLAYASPEQLRGGAVTTAVDVYSLGVLLYRLLCGQPPYTTDGDTFESFRRICESEPPPPSRRVVTAPGTSRRERHARTLRRRLEGDLDSIVLKALAKEPRDRYASIEELAGDLRRHLEGRPVRARRATWLYRVGKFLRRHRGRLVAAALVASLSVAFAASRARDARRVASLDEERQRATEASRKAEEQAETLTLFLRNLLQATDPDERRGGPLTAAEILRRGEERARRDLGSQPDVLAHQLEALGLAHQMLDELTEARPLLEEALRLRRRAHPGDHTLVARSLNNLAALVHEQGEKARAAKLYRLALDMRRRLEQPPEDLARIESNLALLLLERGELAEAEALYRRLLATRRQAFGENDPDVSNSLRSLGTVLYLRGRFEEAEPYLRQALELRRGEPDVRPTRVAAALSSLGRVLHARGRLVEAEEALLQALDLRRRVLGDEHPHVALTRRDLAALYFDLGEEATAKILRDRALSVLRAVSADGWEVADAESRLGERLRAKGRLAEAAVCLQESWETLRRLRGEENLHTRQARERLEHLQNLHAEGLGVAD